MLGTPPAFILSQDRTLIKSHESNSLKSNSVQNEKLGFCSVRFVLLRMYSHAIFRLLSENLLKNLQGLCIIRSLIIKVLSLVSRDSPYRIPSRSDIVKHFLNLFRFKRRGWGSNPRALADKRFSRPPRYDHFDTSAFSLFKSPLSKRLKDHIKSALSRQAESLGFSPNFCNCLAPHRCIAKRCAMWRFRGASRLARHQKNRKNASLSKLRSAFYGFFWWC